MAINGERGNSEYLLTMFETDEPFATVQPNALPCDQSPVQSAHDS